MSFDRGHADGRSLNAIAQTLNEEGVPTPKGGRWYASTIRHVVRSLANEIDLEAIRANRP